MTLKISTTDVGNLFGSTLKEYHDEGFIKVLESHISWFKEQPGASMVSINKVKAIQYAGDFNGLLLSLKLDPKLWYATMRCSGLTSPSEADKDLAFVVIPDLQDIVSLMNRYKINN